MKRSRFLYHGSSKRVNILLPKKASDWKFEAGRHFGVYATSNRDVALAFALGGIPDETGTCHRVIREKDRKTLKMVFVRGHPNFGGKGYLYKLSSKGFRYVGGDQWVCENPVNPIKIIEIKVDDYLHLFRYATEQERLEIESEFRKQMRSRKKKKRNKS
jgi:hypothetical protein